MRWKNFVPAYEAWFNDEFVKKWSRENNTEVMVSNVGLGEIDRLAAEEVKVGEGHDLVLFLSPRPSLEDYTIDHKDIHIECEKRFGEAHEFVRQSIVNPRTGRYHGFAESYAPALVTYRSDVWSAVGAIPDNWDSIRKAGRAAKLLHEAPVGLSLAPEHNADHSLRALMAAFGSFVQNEDGRPSLVSPNTLEVLKFGKALYEETMSPEVLNWTSASNNQAMLSGAASLTIDTMSVVRAAEAKRLPVEPYLTLAKLPGGPSGRGGPAFATNTFIIWRFARNVEGAQKFLLDYIGSFPDGLTKSGFQNMPTFPGAVPDLGDLIHTASKASGRYDVLSDVPDTLTNLGFPGHSNAATDEVINRRIIPEMFARVAKGMTTPQEAMDLAGAAISPIFDKWREAGKI
ncbi:extracellular solute-binding protein [Ruegeria atlantica]|uniref:extracellular solute-binding protein n=1 Tax=Ruegeria atlantica TaxID=81569 RepID=UPI00147F09AC|nr:extracellular solute-binding protein [Ruegeria atlantica]